MDARVTDVKLSAVIACYRDAPAVPAMYERLSAVFVDLGVEFEIIFVNDGSPDDAREILAELAGRDQRVTVINHTRAFGSQSAFTSGMQVATGDAVILLDGDLQDPPELIREFVEKWRSGYDVVYGERVDREASRGMRVGYKLFYRLFRRASYVDVPLDAGDFGLLDRRVVDTLNRLPEKQRFIRGLRAWVGFRQVGIPYVRPKRPYGESTNSLVKNLGWARRAILSFSYAPIDFITWLALVIVGLASVAVVLQIGLRIAFPDAAPKGITTVLVVIFVLGAFQFLCLAIIGSYLAHVYEEVKSRPAYIVDEILNPPGRRPAPAAPVGGRPAPAVDAEPRAAPGPGARSVLVTGAAGFVGANLTRRLLADGHRVTGVVRQGGDMWRLEDVAGDLEATAIDMRDGDALRRVVERVKPDWVFHLAAHGAYSWQNDLRRILETNFLGTVDLVEACRAVGCEALVHAGSSSEYGYTDRPATETDHPEPNSEYAVAKSSATAYCRFVAQSGALNAITLRLYSVYGPYEDPRRLIPTLVTAGIGGQFPPLVAPDVSRDFVAVDDAVEAFLRAATSRSEEPGAIYNVGTGVQTSMREVVAVVREVMSIEAEPVWGSAPPRRWDTTTWVADCSKIHRELGWQAQLSFREGFENTAHWLQSTPSVWPVYGLPPGEAASAGQVDGFATAQVNDVEA